MNLNKWQIRVLVFFSLQYTGYCFPIATEKLQQNQTEHEDSTITCSTRAEDVQICDRVQDGVSIAASLLGGLPHLQGPQGGPGPIGPRGKD